MSPAHQLEGLGGTNVFDAPRTAASFVNGSCASRTLQGSTHRRDGTGRGQLCDYSNTSCEIFKADIQGRDSEGRVTLQ
jgi:hypothetical protein